MTVHDDLLLEGTRTVHVTASAPGITGTGRDTVLVNDDEKAVLTVEIPANADEGAGVLAGVVRVSQAPDRDTTVLLHTDNPDEATVPGEVTVPAGTTSAVFDLTINDDSEFDGADTATITATVHGWTPGSDSVEVADNEVTVLTVTVKPTAIEGDGQLSAAGKVSIPGTFPSPLEITLSSDDTSKAAVSPSAVTVGTGETSAAFDLTVADNGIISGNHGVSITATAPGWTSGADIIVIYDRDNLRISPHLAAGYDHSLAIGDGGKPWAWGNNDSGQLGDGTYTDRDTPAEIPGLTYVKTLAGARYHTVALRADGTVWTWGNNDSGQLGDGTYTGRNTPAEITGLSGVAATACGSSHTAALKDDGTVLAWGANGSGQLGNGTNENSSIPVKVSGLANVTAIAGGADHTLALCDDGTVWAWGSDSSGQLGNGTGTDRNTPVQVSGLSSVTAIAAGAYHSMALCSDGTVRTWGGNWSGQLGDGTDTDRDTPVRVSGPAGVTALAGGDAHTLVLCDDGTAWAWGYNYYGQLGTGDTVSSSVPVRVSGISGVIAAAGGWYHTLALRDDGTVWAWGGNWEYQLGNGTAGDSSTPVQVPGSGGTGELMLYVMSVSVPAEATEGDVLTGMGKVTLMEPPGSDLVVSLSSDDPSELTVPPSVTVAGDQTSAVFDLTAENDSYPDGSHPVTVSASADSFTVTGTIMIHDSSSAVLTLEIPGTAKEGDGVISGTVRTDRPVGADTFVTLVSDSPDELAVPGKVTISAGNDSAVFDMTVNDDTAIDGPRTVNLSASVTGWTCAGASVTIEDNEVRDLTLALPEGVNENCGTLSGAGTVSIPGTLASDLGVSLSSDSITHVAVPSSVTIAAGHVSAEFALTVINNQESDGLRIAEITASAVFPGDSVSISDTREIAIADDETTRITMTDNDSNEEKGVPDNDMGRELRPCVLSTDQNHPIEFGTDLKGNLPVSGAYVSVFTEGPAEKNEVFLNGHSLGFASDSPGLKGSLFPVPDISWLNPGYNLIRISADTGGDGKCLTVLSGEIIPDYAGTGAAFIRTASSDSGAYDYSTPVTVTVEADTNLAAQNIRFELSLADPHGNVILTDDRPEAAAQRITSVGNDAWQWSFTLPGSGPEGLWSVSAEIYDAGTNVFADIRHIMFAVPSGAETGPEVLSVTPDSCIAGRTGSVVITGRNFIPGNTVCTVGNVPAENLTVFGTTALSANVSAQTPKGTHAVRCTTSKGTGELPDSFTVMPTISVSPGAADFGETEAGTDSPGTVITVTNTGPDPRVMGTPSVTGADTSEFVILNDGCGGMTLAPSESCTLGAVFRPSGAGQKSADIEIPSDSPDTGVLRAGLSGEGFRREIAFSSGTYAVTETEGGTVAEISVSLSGPSAHTVTAQYTASDGTADAGDYTAVSGTLSLAPGEITRTFSVSISDDTADEDDETVILTLASPANATLGSTASALLVITDNDPAPSVQFSSGTYAVGESSGSAQITVSISAPGQKTVTADYASADGTARAGTDYDAVSGTLTFAPGETAKTFAIPVTDDAVHEPDETVSITLANIVNAVPGTVTGAVLTITDDDQDNLPPEDVTNPGVQCSEGSLTISWDHSANTAGDLAGYKVYYDGDTAGVSLGPDVSTWEKTGLADASSHFFRITAYDDKGNESTGITVTGVTLLPNPAGLSAAPSGGRADLAWDHIPDTGHLRHYSVWVSETDFSDTGGMTPGLTTTENSATVGNLADGVTYYFAVTSANTSDCERRDAVTVQATPLADSDGPELTDIRMGNTLLKDGHVMFRSGTVTLNASDISGVSRIEFRMDEVLICTDSDGSGGWSCHADIAGLENGSHTLRTDAYDTVGNVTTKVFAIAVSHLPPFECFSGCVPE